MPKKVLKLFMARWFQDLRSKALQLRKKTRLPRRLPPPLLPPKPCVNGKNRSAIWKKTLLMRTVSVALPLTPQAKKMRILVTLILKTGIDEDVRGGFA